MGFMIGHSFVQERKSEFYEDVERTRYNFRPCCGTHLELKSLGRISDRSSQLDKADTEFQSKPPFALQQCQFPISRKIHSNASNCIELDSQRIIRQFEALKLSSHSLKFKLIRVNVEEILIGLELRCIQRHLIVG